MKIPPKAWLKIRPEGEWKLILPYQKRTITAEIRAGYNDMPYQVQVQGKTNINTTGSYPIRIVKKQRGYKVGPIVGILTVDGKNGFRGNRKNFMDIIKAGIDAGVMVYVFTAEAISHSSDQIQAYLYLPSLKRWVKRLMPLPDVVYNRIPFRIDENKPYVKEAIHHLQNIGIPLFNPYFFDKWTLFKWLRENRELSYFMPTTDTLSREHLSEQLRAHSSIYIKPVHGKAGVGFLKVIKRDGKYLLTYQNAQRTYSTEFKSYPPLWNKIRTLVKNQEYIIQQAITLKTYHNRPFDVRVLVQKNGNGDWKVSGIGIRVAGVKSITTHVPRGGFIASVDQVFQQVFGSQAESWKSRVSDIALRMANYIEQKSGSTLGEMSMDFGIEENNRTWFFEANSKPMKFDEPKIRKTSLTRLMQYSRYLSNFD